MDFSVSEKMQTILGMMKEFVQKELIPLEAETLNKSFSEILPELEEKRKMVKQMELWSPLMPKEYGGMELNLMESALVYEALGGTPFGLFVFGSAARHRMQAISRSCINTEPKSKKKNGCDRSLTVRYGAVFQ
jgi:alkylation response protein AidB-like acyl-CoA dehydrogenase